MHVKGAYVAEVVELMGYVVRKEDQYLIASTHVLKEKQIK
jgi:hypothetical protein